MSSVLGIQQSNGSHPIGEFRNDPPTDFSRRAEREAFEAALQEAAKRFPTDVPLIIGGRRVERPETIPSRDPSRKLRVVANVAAAGADDVHSAVKAARGAYAEWSRTVPEERAEILLRAAELMRQQRYLLSAVLVHEAGKPWREADADTAEAIDFLEYYAREMMRLGRPRRLQSHILGERNEMLYSPIGVVGVIGPWNFPLAIVTGMSSAAMIAGNTVVLKPAEQTPLIAYLYVKLLEKAGLPPGVMNLVPGRGEVAGAALVRHPDVNMIVFTGSREVGLHIIREAATVAEGQRFVKRVVTEMGGKNAIIIDSSCDLDAAIPDVLYSAFGFSGQKCSACSRLVVMEDVYDECLQRLRDGVESLKIGPAEDPATQVGPLTDEDALAKVLRYQELGRKEARTVVLKDPGALADEGYFVGPAVFEVDSPRHALAQEEIFGPVLAVLSARDFNQALAIANDTPYALTGGVHSRTLSHLEQARREYEVGNLYLNRTITGAIVGRQPFGGFRLSGIGSKAGGPDYLKQFLVARSISENQMRHGMASLKEPPPDVWEE
jgi:RHH-type proline utilization regulon transcriptional repressor/proline dehydrogenase/delta 1-pyrroline-5-carboxylate dehydrogenase